MEKTADAIVIQMTGDSGDGIQVMGEQLTLTATRIGRTVRTLPDFPAEIRAPQGTVAGVSGFQLAMSDKALFTAGESLDVLVALNPAALKKAIPYLKWGGLLILNEEAMQPKDFEKAGGQIEQLETLSAQYRVLSFPLIQYTLKALEGLPLTQVEAKKTKNFYILGVILWLFDLPYEACQSFIAHKFKRYPAVAQGNERALLAGYNYAMTLELSRQPYVLGPPPRTEGAYRPLNGVTAVGLALATLAIQLKHPVCVCGYPITPSSAILEYCVKLKSYGVQLFQAEDEIAALCAAIGAAFGGALAITCTSGPGLDLKSEGLGLAVISELPLVVLDVQRAGASTGLPTKTGQSDLRQALYGRHGEAPLPVLAPQSPSDCFFMILEAFDIAIRAMTPVIVLMDAYLAVASEPWQMPNLEDLPLPKWTFNRFPKPYQRDEHLSRSWNLPGTPAHMHQIGGLEKQGEEGRVSYDAANHQAMVQVRAKKIANIAHAYPPLSIEGDRHAPLLIVGWGSTYGSLRATLEACKSLGISVALLHLRYLNPLPQDLGELLSAYAQVIVFELNSGQLCEILRSTFLLPLKSFSQCNGQPFVVSDLVQCIREMSLALV